MKVLVTLGNMLNDDNSMSPSLLSRLQLTKEVAPQYDVILLTGGICNPKSTKSEAEAMGDWLVENGIPREKLMMETKSTTTEENAKFCSPILKELGVHHITVLSSAFHIDRDFANPKDLFREHCGVTLDALSAKI